MPPPPPERGLEDDPPDEPLDDPPDDPPLPPEECDEPLLPDDGRLTPAEPPLLPRFEGDEPELLLPPRTEVPELPEPLLPRPPLLEVVEPLLGERRAPPIEPMTRLTVAPLPRHESPDEPLDCVEPDAPTVDGRLTGSPDPPLTTVRGLAPADPPDVEVPLVPALVLPVPPRTGRPRHSPLGELVLVLVPVPPRSIVEPLSFPLRGFSSDGAAVSWFLGELLPPVLGRLVDWLPALAPPELVPPPEIVPLPELVLPPPPRGTVPVGVPPRGLVLTLPVVVDPVALPLVVPPRSIVPPPPRPPRGPVVAVGVEALDPADGSVVPGREALARVPPWLWPLVTRFLMSCGSAGSLWKN